MKAVVQHGEIIRKFQIFQARMGGFDARIQNCNLDPVPCAFPKVSPSLFHAQPGIQANQSDQPTALLSRRNSINCDNKDAVRWITLRSANWKPAASSIAPVLLMPAWSTEPW